MPLERDINIAVNGPFWLEVANPEHPFMAMLISRSRGTYLIILDNFEPTFLLTLLSFPQVCTACAVDLVKRCLCECGRFSLLDFCWFSMILFQSEWDFDGFQISVCFLNWRRKRFGTGTGLLWNLIAVLWVGAAAGLSGLSRQWSRRTWIAGMTDKILEENWNLHLMFQNAINYEFSVIVSEIV